MAFTHGLVLPLIAPGVPGVEPNVTESVLGEVVPQSLVPVTETLPELVPQFTVILGDPVPDAIVAPAGTVQL